MIAVGAMVVGGLGGLDDLEDPGLAEDMIGGGNDQIEEELT